MLLTDSNYILHTILRKTPFYLTQHTALNGLRKGQALCFLRGMNWMFWNFYRKFQISSG
jgi:hypothetical protein